MKNHFIFSYAGNKRNEIEEIYKHMKLKTYISMKRERAPVKTSKGQIVHPRLSEEGVIPKLNRSTILVDRSGSGKSVLLHNLLTRPEFFHKYKNWDTVFIISPTAECDYVQKGTYRPVVFSPIWMKQPPLWTRLRNFRWRKSKRRARTPRRNSVLSSTMWLGTLSL